MFSDANQRYIASLVATMRDEYPYYIAYSDARNGSSDTPSIYIIFTKEKITAEGMYSYEVPAGVKYSIITNNYSSYSTNSARHSVTNWAGGSVTVPVYEFVYTNAEFTGSAVQPDVNSLYGGDYYAQTQSTNFILVVVSVACLLIMLFKPHY